MIEKDYRFKEVEEKWVKTWRDDMYSFDWNSRKPHYIIDTPPPYPTGSFHLGNALNWCYIDFIARYKRMKGYEVMFPQGWDCHGLPTEVKVEELYGISKGDIPREEFRRLCIEFTKKNIDIMKKTMKRLGFSIDWTKEYITMLPEYYKKTQLSFIKMYKMGLIYKGYHPVVFCPRCQTTIALAEIEYRSTKTLLNYIVFGEGENKVTIATTRPELIPACVAIAVHPEDDRYRHLIGKKVRIPIFNYDVEIIADEEVDPEFGTGIVMICTFGDKQDVKWWKKHKLDLRIVLEKNGRLNDKAGKYKGLTTLEARKKILEDLKADGRLVKQEEIEQSLGVCWRCKTPVEIVIEDQWFIKVDKERILNEARKIRWIPEHMFYRLKSWVEGMEWDWVISRQRIFATPIPVWYCKRCNSIIVAKEEWLPVDPTRDLPKEPCPNCGGTSFEGERDVLDTWMDSSITPLVIAGWPDLKEYPVNLRPQGHDIIRTWAFYTILRSLALVGRIPWYEIVINGMVLGEDGRKMSKSLGNIVEPDEIIEKYGADALRQWAASGVVGDDVIFSWKEIVFASRFQQKFWSILRFTLMHLKDEPKDEDTRYLRDADRWILSRLIRVIKDVDEHMENYRFSEALKTIRSFAWYEYADNYLEIVKNRLYSGTEDEKKGARFVLYKVINVLIRLLAPFTPFLAEECWYRLNERIGRKANSVHLQSYPSVYEIFRPLLNDSIVIKTVEEFDRNILTALMTDHKSFEELVRFEWDKIEKILEKIERRGELIKEIVSEIRRFKHDRGLPLNAPLKRVMIYLPEGIDTRDLEGAVNSKVEVLNEIPDIEIRVKKLKPKFNIIGPMFKDRVKDIIKSVANLSNEEKVKFIKDGFIEIELNGKKIKLDINWFDAEIEKTLAGEEIEVLETKNSVLVVEV